MPVGELQPRQVQSVSRPTPPSGHGLWPWARRPYSNEAVGGMSPQTGRHRGCHGLCPWGSTGPGFAGSLPVRVASSLLGLEPAALAPPESTGSAPRFVGRRTPPSADASRSGCGPATPLTHPAPHRLVTDQWLVPPRKTGWERIAPSTPPRLDTQPIEKRCVSALVMNTRDHADSATPFRY